MQGARVVVVGAGIAGLAAAHRLTERAGAGSVLVVERERRVGGKIATERVDGYLVEGGPDCFLSAKPAGVTLCRALGIEDRLVGTNPAMRRSFVKRRGRLHELPAGMTGLVPSRLRPLVTTGILSPLGRLRAGLEFVVPPAQDGADESVASFVTRRFGTEAYRWLVEPLLSGIFAGDGAALSIAATFPQLREMERANGSVLRAMLRGRQPAAGAHPGFVTLAGGLGEMVAVLRERLPADGVVCGVSVTRLRRAGADWEVTLSDGSALEASAVVLAVPALDAAELVENVDSELASVLREIPFVSTVTVSVGFQATAIPLLHGYGYVSPRAEGGHVVACTWTSNKFPDRVPEGGVLIRFFLGRAGDEGIAEAGDGDLTATVRRELSAVLGVEAEPAFWRIFRWPRGLPQYTLGHPERLARIGRRLAAHPGLVVAGCSYRGVGIPDCIESGWAAAGEAASALARSGS